MLQTEMQVMPAMGGYSQADYNNNPLLWLLLLSRGLLNQDGTQPNAQLQFTELKSALQNIGNGIASTAFENAKSFAELQAAMQSCCCETQKAIIESKYETSKEIAELKFEQAKSTAEIIHHQDHNTQRILDEMCRTEKDALRDKNAELERKLLVAELKTK